MCWKAEDLAADAEQKQPDPLLTLNRFEARRTSDRIFADILERHGESRMAGLFHTDPEGHAYRRETGRQFFYGPEDTEEPWDPGWLPALLRTVADAVVASPKIDSLEYGQRREWDSCEVHVRPASANTEGWALDLEKLRGAFDAVDGAGWYAAPGTRGGVPYCWIDGTFQDHEVFLRVLADVTPAAEPGEHYQVWKRG